MLRQVCYRAAWRGSEILARSLQLDLISCRPYSPSPPSQTPLVRRSRASRPKARKWHLALTMLLHQWPGFLGLVSQLNPHVETPGGGVGCTSVACCSFNLLPTLGPAVAGRFVPIRVANAESSASEPEFGNAKPISKPAASFHSCPQSGAADAPTLTRGSSQNAFAQ